MAVSVVVALNAVVLIWKLAQMDFLTIPEIIADLVHTVLASA